MSILETILVTTIATAIATTIATAIGALIGTYVGSYLINQKSEKRNKKLRELAISALNLFKEYAKDDKTFKTVENDFNNEFNVSQKRAMLVLLQKIGVPVLMPINEIFDIKNVKFSSEMIGKESINEMIEQVKGGYCDDLFYIDVDKYFGDEVVINTRRDIALKYVDEIMIHNQLDDTKKEIKNKKCLTDVLTIGEINILQVFMKKNDNAYYYDADGKIDTKKLDKLKDEVKSGLWDKYFEWDGDAYENILEQRRFVQEFPLNLRRQTVLNKRLG